MPFNTSYNQIDMLIINSIPFDAELTKILSKHFLPSESVIEIVGPERACEFLETVKKETQSPEAAERSPVTLILFDVDVPGTSDFEALRKIRELPWTGQIPIVVLSSSAEKNEIDRCRAAGATDYVVKPIEFTQYRETIKTICNRYFGGAGRSS